MGPRSLFLVFMYAALMLVALAYSANTHLQGANHPLSTRRYASYGTKGSIHRSQDLSTAKEDCLGSCLKNPQAANCTSCTLPPGNTTHDLDMLCNGDMEDMIGCSVRRACLQGNVDGRYCSDMSILGDICVGDPGMGAMHACSSYKLLCNASGTVVQQCFKNSPIPNVLGTKETISNVLQACDKMYMDGCKHCHSDGNCQDPLRAISSICLSMRMSECDQWERMCDSIDGNSLSYFCGTKDERKKSVMMRMYFHTGLSDYFLLKGWVPTTYWQYTLTFIFTILLGIFTQFLKALRSVGLRKLKAKREQRRRVGEAHHHRDHSVSSTSLEDGEPLHRVYESDHLLGHIRMFKVLSPATIAKLRRYFILSVMIDMYDSFKRDISLADMAFRGLGGTLITALDYLLMLIAMTYNVGLFIAVCLGFGLGHFLFGKIIADAGGDTDSVDSCCE